MAGNQWGELATEIDNYRQLLERVPAIVYIADTGDVGIWHYVSPQIEAILGYTPEEWCANPRLWRDRLHPADRERVLNRELARCAANATHLPTSTGCCTGTGTPSGSATTPRCYRDSAGRLRWHGVLSDISQHKLVEAELERRAAQQAAVARLGERALEQVESSELIEQACQAATEILEVELATVAELADRRRSGCAPASAGRRT